MPDLCHRFESLYISTTTQLAIHPGLIKECQQELGSKRTYHEMQLPCIRGLAASVGVQLRANKTMPMRLTNEYFKSFPCSSGSWDSTVRSELLTWCDRMSTASECLASLKSIPLTASTASPTNSAPDRWAGRSGWISEIKIGTPCSRPPYMHQSLHRSQHSNSHMAKAE